jgi:hypothetical protein
VRSHRGPDFQNSVPIGIVITGLDDPVIHPSSKGLFAKMDGCPDDGWVSPTPLLWGGMAESINLFLPTRQAKYFLRAHWTRNWPDSPSGQISRPSRSIRARKLEVLLPDLQGGASGNHTFPT